MRGAGVAQLYIDRYYRCQYGACAGTGAHSSSPEITASRRLSRCRYCAGPGHSRDCRQCRTFGPTGRDRSNTPHVRCRSPFFFRRSAGSSPDSSTRGLGPDRGGNGARRLDGHHLGLGPGGCNNIWPGALSGQHGGSLKDAGTAGHSSVPEWKYRGGLAGRGGPRHGPVPCLAAAAFRLAH